MEQKTNFVYKELSEIDYGRTKIKKKSSLTMEVG